MTTKTAFITGASRGIGKASAIRLTQLGYNLIAHHRNPDANFTELQTSGHKNGTTVTTVAAVTTGPDTRHPGK